MQETWVWSLIWEDPTCQGATEPVIHNHWACALAPGAAAAEAHVPGVCALRWEATAVRRPGTTAREQPPLATQEKSHTATKTQTAKKKRLKKKEEPKRILENLWQTFSVFTLWNMISSPCHPNLLSNYSINSLQNSSFRKFGLYTTQPFLNSISTQIKLYSDQSFPDSVSTQLKPFSIQCLNQLKLSLIQTPFK